MRFVVMTQPGCSDGADHPVMACRLAAGRWRVVANRIVRARSVSPVFVKRSRGPASTRLVTR
jgi:hypothetical protein